MVFAFSKKELFVGMSWTQCYLTEKNRLKNLGDVYEQKNGEKVEKKTFFYLFFLRKIGPLIAGVQGFIYRKTTWQASSFSIKEVI